MLARVCPAERDILSAYSRSKTRTLRDCKLRLLLLLLVMDTSDVQVYTHLVRCLYISYLPVCPHDPLKEHHAIRLETSKVSTII